MTTGMTPDAPRVALDEASPRPAASTGARVAAGLAGALALAVAALLTAGMALSAPVGIAVAAAIARRRRTVLSRGASWLGATAGAAIVVVALGGFFVAGTPTGTFAQIGRTMDSASTAAAPPPAWLERVAPGSTAAAAKRTPSGPISHAFAAWALVTGGVLTCAILAALIGTLGWLASMPLVYAVTGRWLEPPAAPVGYGFVVDS